MHAGLMAEVIREPAAIERHLRELRALQRRAREGVGSEALDTVLEMHHVTVEPGPEDYWHGPGIPLRNTLSLFDRERLRRRVSEISIDVAHREESLRLQRAANAPFPPVSDD